jgi:hypothetical protein
MFRGVGCWFVTDVSGQRIGYFFKAGSSVAEESDLLT